MLDPIEGLYVAAAYDICFILLHPQCAHLSASVGFFEIYQDQLYDLLNRKAKLEVLDDGSGKMVIPGLKERPISNGGQLMSVLEDGRKERATGRTDADETSSRSHAVLQVILRTNDDPTKVFGKLSFIDMAGSKRGADWGDVDAKTRNENAGINKSLFALKECIRALDQDKKHIPFRGSKLTQVLRDSFVSNSRTCMIATISPSVHNSADILNTLRFAEHVKEIQRGQ